MVNINFMELMVKLRKLFIPVSVRVGGRKDYL